MVDLIDIRYSYIRMKYKIYIRLFPIDDDSIMTKNQRAVRRISHASNLLAHTTQRGVFLLKVYICALFLSVFWQ